MSSDDITGVPASASPYATDAAGTDHTGVYRVKDNPAEKALVASVRKIMKSYDQSTRILRGLMNLARSISSILEPAPEVRANRVNSDNRIVTRPNSTTDADRAFLAALEIRKSVALAYNRHNQLA